MAGQELYRGDNVRVSGRTFSFLSKQIPPFIPLLETASPELVMSELMESNTVVLKSPESGSFCSAWSRSRC